MEAWKRRGSAGAGSAAGAGATLTLKDECVTALILDQLLELSQLLRLYQVVVDARAQRFPTEERYCYQPFAGLEDEHRYHSDTIRDILTDYNLRDLGI